ncbi:unnamed protein product [Symbiodinium necroappetens]|uniref:Uncharacterized protein n=1 Tax=Symbiodinium necroappetens TaxID=1628268 RepID=A0A812PJJ7_9DINO|nr:unnamed protein product [Symbiodinium necroappetens]
MEDMGGLPSPLPDELTSACTWALPSLLACLKARVINNREITKAELGVLMHVAKCSDNASEWWALQGTILKNTILAQTAASQYQALGNTAAVRASRDSKGQRLETYCKGMITLMSDLEKSDALESQIAADSKAKPAMEYCAVAQTSRQACFHEQGRACLEQGLAALFETHRAETTGILSALDSHTMQYELPGETSWKSWSQELQGRSPDDKELGDLVMTTAAATIATLKGGLINNDFKNLEQASKNLESFHSKFQAVFDKGICTGSVMDDCVALSRQAKVRSQQVSVLMIESVLNLGIVGNKADIIEAQIEKLKGKTSCEKDVCKVLLHKARAVLGK